ncbi:hypothetical protein PCANC_19430 [Puccinia coronata f. sp. avenae]|uniref:Reverse transcriptase Ty1/copia-type domain-containing protein n=1 Tax=Puccinia coronata f. sp. avenae TaxID=200324 RepID=A0A2N5V1A0_9BASI|nr:hypothetical protein PCANC_19430 [Puccinia coronata f. sp. avenae]
MAPSNIYSNVAIQVSVNYVLVGTRPNIAYSVNCLAWFSSKPSPINWKALKHLLGYLAATKDRVLNISPKTSGTVPVECFVDANWGGPSSQSTYGVLMQQYGCPIMWLSRRLVTAASLTCQAEYMALGHAIQHSLWIRNLLANILGVGYPIQIFCDNQLAAKIGCKESSNKRTHHVKREFYITNQAMHKKTSSRWIPGMAQLADVLTKALGKGAHEKAGFIVQGHSVGS